MYLLGAGLDKTTYQATTVIVFWFINAIKLPFYLALGMFTARSALVNFILGPIAVAGVFIGVWAHDLVEEKRVLPADLRAARGRGRQAHL